MKNKIFIIFTIFSVLATVSFGQEEKKKCCKKSKKKKCKTEEVVSFKLKTDVDSVSYAIGNSIAKDMIVNQFEITPEALAKGFTDVFDSTIMLTDEEIVLVMESFRMKLQAQNQQKQVQKTTNAKQDGIEFLIKNKTNKGVKATPSGLQYKVVKEGEGESPVATDKVKVHYEGTLINGDIFDSSYKRGEPIVFPLNAVIPGWTEGVQLMKPGAIHMLYIPSDLAYGDRGTPSIPGGSTLIFKVELLEVVKEEKIAEPEKSTEPVENKNDKKK